MPVNGGNSSPRRDDLPHPHPLHHVRTVFPEVPVISVRTSAEIPKDKIFDVMREINRARVTRPMKRGEAVLPNVLGLGVDIIITSGLLEEKTEKENDHEQ